MRRVLKFSLRDMIFVTAIVALALALWLTVRKLPDINRPGGFPAGGPHTTIVGPLTVSYREQTSPNSTSGSSGVALQALHFIEDGVVFEYTNGRFRRIGSSRLVELSWQAQQ